MYLSRTIETTILRASAQFPVVLLTGARQVGKTTLLRHISGADRTYVSLDDPLVLELARRDPALFLQRFRPPLLVDEIQYAPALLPLIKLAVDAAHQPGMFWITGSQQFHLMQGVSESLAGRVAVLRMLGLSRREILREPNASCPFVPDPGEVQRRVASGGTLDLQALYATIWRGALPAVATNDEIDHGLFYGSYLQTYLQRDVRDLAHVGDMAAFLRFLRAAAVRTGQLLNMADLARDAGVAPNTARAWLSILEASGVVYLLEPHHANLTKRLVKAPKLYFLDTGLCAYLAEWSSARTLEAGAMSGAILETWVVAELLKAWLHQGRRPPFTYFRDRDQREIDLVISMDGVLHPIEVKKTASPSPGDVRAFKQLGAMGAPRGYGGLVCLAQLSLPITAEVVSIPVAAL